MEENKEQKLNEFGMPEMSYEATKKALERPKVWRVDEMIEAKAKYDEQIIKELAESGSISFGIIGVDGKFTEQSKFESKK
jgi:hypothetical protein